MKCSKCGMPSAVSFQQPLCQRCFCRSVEKRIRKDARVSRWFRKNDRLCADSRLSAFLINRIVPHLPRRMVKNRTAKAVSATTADDIIADFLKSIFNGRHLEKSGSIPLLRSITDDEAQAFARLNRISFRPKRKDRSITLFIAELQQKHPETKASLMRAVSRSKL